MCEECGCGDHHIVSLDVQTKLLGSNDEQAQHNREHFSEAGVVAINLMGSPGAGKTAVLEATAAAIGNRYALGAVSGDLATDNDGERLRKAGIPSTTITTGSACHLDARLVHDELHNVPWRETDFFFIENVGNLVCPAIYDLGQNANVVVLSVTEGEDKPLKYPVMFRVADLVLITKMDLLEHLPQMSIETLEENVRRTMPGAKTIRMAAATGLGVREWVEWLEARRG
ncbi:MAG: hydrogenase accessory protein HypB [Deltaproteobacteria bacterium RIFOXYA12_FULL_58_15]|nr:MAG: hydrogenase accessory protein HypB [Deltaproteobacteria bacterium RIFOXYA12_FULL_58_15]